MTDIVSISRDTDRQLRRHGNQCRSTGDYKKPIHEVIMTFQFRNFFAPSERAAARDTVNMYVRAFTAGLKATQFDFVWGTCHIQLDTKDGLDFRDRSRMSDAAIGRHKAMMHAFESIVARTRAIVDRTHSGYEIRIAVFIDDKPGSAPHFHYVSAVPLGTAAAIMAARWERQIGGARMYDFNLVDLRVEADQRRKRNDICYRTGQPIRLRDVIIEKLEYAAGFVETAVKAGHRHDHLVRFFPRQLSPLATPHRRARGRDIARQIEPTARIEPVVKTIKLEGLSNRQLRAYIENLERDGKDHGAEISAAQAQLRANRRAALLNSRMP
ncbi:hypothetical protein [Prosthecomicrobium sp. N25]|uniref:hypothetical protein n=1 Tax=Prosthecomicrobium sp. N25 TaxID=3129254 RepID=UPI003077E1C3